MTIANANRVIDPNMELARLLAQHLGPTPELPASLQSVQYRAELVHGIDGPLIDAFDNLDLYSVVARIAARVRDIAETSKEYMPDVQDSLMRVNIALRLWSGCLSAAKTIAYETRSGTNTPEGRAQIMGHIDQIASTDEIYAAGVEAAPAFKRFRNQGYSFEGVPQSSRVRRYP